MGMSRDIGGPVTIVTIIYLFVFLVQVHAPTSGKVLSQNCKVNGPSRRIGPKGISPLYSDNYCRNKFCMSYIYPKYIQVLYKV